MDLPTAPTKPRPLSVAAFTAVAWVVTMSDATRGPHAATLVHPGTDSLRQVFESAVQLAASDDSDLERLLSQALEAAASRFDAERVALVTLSDPDGITCDIEFAKRGCPRSSESIGHLTEPVRRSLVLELTGSDSNACLDKSDTDPSGAIQRLKALSGVGVTAQCGGTRFALLLGGPRVPDPDGEDAQQYLRALLRLLSQTARRLRSARIGAESLRQSNKAALAGRAIVSLAHDFNNTLYSIGCVSDVMLLNLGDSNSIRKSVDDIKRMATRAASLTRRLMTFGRQGTGTVTPVELSEVLTSWRPVLQAILGPRVTLQLEIDDGSMQALTDRSLLEQLLLEAALVAQSCLPVQSPLVVRLSTSPAATKPTALRSPDQRARIFRLTIGCSCTDACLNFGDSHVLKSLTVPLAHAGVTVLRCDSRLEAAICEAVPPSVLTVGPVMTSDAPKTLGTILLVEDEEISRRATVHILSRKGYQVLAADSYQSAASILSTHQQPISALVTDVVLPDGDGVALYGILRTSQPNSKAIFVSGYSSRILDQRGDAVGHGFLQKPCRPGELLQLLQQVLTQG